MAPDKSVYQLWFEFLRRSNNYKMFAELALAAMRDPNKGWNTSFELWSREWPHEGYWKVLLWLRKYIRLEDFRPNKKFDPRTISSEDEDMAMLQSMRIYFAYYQGMEAKDFDDAWEKRMKWLVHQELAWKDEQEVAWIYSDREREEINALLLERKTWPIDKQEFERCLDSFSDFLSDGIYPYIGINLYKPKSEIMNRVSELIDKAINILPENFLKCSRTTPTGVIRHNELQRYLALYDCKYGCGSGRISNREIVRRLYGDVYQDIDDAVLEKARARMSKELARARKIIANVEKGFFPGVYN